MSDAAALVDGVLREAVRRGATAIHFEPGPSSFRVRARIGGVLEPLRELPRGHGDAIVARLKVLAGLDVDRHDVEDGRLTLGLADAIVSFGVTATAGAHGDAAIVRVHGKAGTPYFPDFTFDALGLVGDDRVRMDDALARPGIVILAGPTRSSKQPMLYAALRSLDDGARKLLSIEWVLRAGLPGIHQIAVDHDKGLGFDIWLRTVPRLDVDVIGVGELVDCATAAQAFELAGRGLTLISTLHVHRAGDAFGRLLNMGIEPWLLAESVSLVQAQRRIRTLCGACRVRDADGGTVAGATAAELAAGTLYRAAGCPACYGSGYAGRALVVESLAVTPAIAKRVRHGEVTGLTGARSLRRAALARALAGETSIAEVLRVTPADE